MTLKMVGFPRRTLILGLAFLALFVAITLLTNRPVYAPSHPASQGITRDVTQAPPTVAPPTLAPTAQPAPKPTPRVPPGPPNSEPIANTAPPSSDAMDGGYHIANTDPGGGSAGCSATKSCQ